MRSWWFQRTFPRTFRRTLPRTFRRGVVAMSIRSADGQLVGSRESYLAPYPGAGEAPGYRGTGYGTRKLFCGVCARRTYTSPTPLLESAPSNAPSCKQIVGGRNGDAGADCVVSRCPPAGRHRAMLSVLHVCGQPAVGRLLGQGGPGLQVYGDSSCPGNHHGTVSATMTIMCRFRDSYL